MMHIIAQVQPMPQQVGQVIALRPQFTDTADGVTAGQEVFVTQSDGTYASETNAIALGTGDGSALVFTGTAFKVRPSSLSIYKAGVKVAHDNGANAIVPETSGVTGTVNYDTGEISVTFTSAPTAGQAIAGAYNANTETDAAAIRELELGLRIIPVIAKSHPLRLTWSVQAQLAATATINLDVEDTLSVVAGQFLKIERDRQLIQYIATLAGAVDADLTMSVAAVAGLSRRAVFNDSIIIIEKGGNKIFAASGRGHVAWIIAGNNASVVFKSLYGFKQDANVVPIGAHVLGTVNDTITLIKDPYLTSNDFIVGYNGVLPGDAGVIVADWIPIYFTPTFQSPDLRGQKALLSMYDVVNNISTSTYGVAA